MAVDTGGYVYPMGVVERITGLTRRRIRYYEKVGLLQPARTSGGHRLYSAENVDTLRRIGALIESGITTVEAVRRIMAAGLDLPERPVAAPGRPVPGPRDRWAPPPSSPRITGDAATRLLRPTSPGPLESRSPSAMESDSASYFNRIRIWAGTSRVTSTSGTAGTGTGAGTGAGVGAGMGSASGVGAAGTVAKTGPVGPVSPPAPRKEPVAPPAPESQLFIRTIEGKKDNPPPGR